LPPNEVPLPKPVLLIRAAGNAADADALAELGLKSVTDPYLDIRSLPGPEGYSAATALLEGLSGLGEGDWVIATSANGLKHWAALYGENNLRSALIAASVRGVRFAAIGPASSRLYSKFGIQDVLVPGSSYGEALAAAVIAAAGAGEHRALVPGGNLAMPTLSNALTDAGWQVTSIAVYMTSPVSIRPSSADALAHGDFSAVLVRSPSAAHAIFEFCGATSVPFVCGGQTTAQAARDLGYLVAAVANDTAPTALAQTIFEVVNSPEGAA
jgi:uroporphyrinogen-III synthase